MHAFLAVQVVHTGKSVEGQIYIPEVNWLLCVLGIAVVAGFRDTVAIGNAFGEPHFDLQPLHIASYPPFGRATNHQVIILLPLTMSCPAAGLVVVTVMVIITVLITVVMLVVWNWHPIPALAIFAFLFTMEGVYLSALLYKVCKMLPVYLMYRHPNGGGRPPLTFCSFCSFSSNLCTTKDLDRHRSLNSVELKRSMKMELR